MASIAPEPQGHQNQNMLPKCKAAPLLGILQIDIPWLVPIKTDYFLYGLANA